MPENPATLGQYYTVWMTRFVLTATPGPGMNIANIPVYGYPGDTWMNVSPSYIGQSPQFPGLYQVNLQLPTSIAGGGYASGYPPLFSWKLQLGIGVEYWTTNLPC
jgi:uncharacterized protein (TIGR03437 family)